MKRSEACRLLTNLATSEFIDKAIGREILKARDIVVCEPNKVLDVLATEETRKKYLRILEIYLRKITSTLLLDKEIEKEMIELCACIHEGDDYYSFQDPCDEMFIPMRCQNCKNYRGK